MNLKNEPLSSIVEGTRAAAGGVITFAFGVLGGSYLVKLISDQRIVTCCESPFEPTLFVLFAMGELWGLLLIPLYGIIFFGLVWGEWSRLINCSVLAMSTSIILLIAFRENPFSERIDTFWFLVSEGLLVAALGIGVLLERRRKCPTSR